MQCHETARVPRETAVTGPLLNPWERLQTFRVESMSPTPRCCGFWTLGPREQAVRFCEPNSGGGGAAGAERGDALAGGKGPREPRVEMLRRPRVGGQEGRPCMQTVPGGGQGVRRFLKGGMGL
jgi:hypothetical protein